jgi:aspartate-semialdehyde dehydrogenase
MKVAVIGVTGLVGQVFLKVLEERDLPVEILIPVASEKSIGSSVTFRGKEWEIIGIDKAIEEVPDVALFSAGGAVSLEYAPKFATKGTVVIDNSSAWRMHKDIKLVVPEINGAQLNENDKIIANPNCSTIQMVVALNELHKKYQIKRIVVSTYQSVTGTGKDAVTQLMGERKRENVPKIYPHVIDMNAIPHIDTFLENNYTKEEMKMVNETRKILGNENIRITATCVRLPVMGGHSESVNVEFHNEFEITDVMNILSETEGVIVQDNVSENIYPMPLLSQGKDDVFVGRVRRDESQPKTLNLWIVSDNLRKGAATNAVQIVEYLQHCELIPT